MKKLPENAAFVAIKSQAALLKMPEKYTDDLNVHDKNQIAKQGNETPFLWFVRPWGTHMIGNKLPPYGPDNCGWGSSPHRAYVDCVNVNFGHAHAGGRQGHWFHWCNERLVEITLKQAREIADGWDVAGRREVNANGLTAFHF